MDINDTSETLNKMPESPKPTENTVNQQSANSIITQPSVNLPDESKPSYLAFLRFFAGLSLVVGIFASVAFVLNIFYEMNRSSYEKSTYGWLISLALALESYLAFGLLNAVADIAENMIDVGSYVRKLRGQKKP